MRHTKEHLAAIPLLALIRFADDGGSIGSDASRPIDPIRASGGVALFDDSERADRKHDCECNKSHLVLSSNHL